VGISLYLKMSVIALLLPIWTR